MRDNIVYGTFKTGISRNITSQNAFFAFISALYALQTLAFTTIKLVLLTLLEYN